MKTVLIAASIALSLALAPSQAAARSYDCSKPGNANEAVCKNAAKTTTKSAKPSKSNVTPAKVSPTTAAQSKKVRTYDCTKRGNANKAQCKASASTELTPAKPVAQPRPATRVSPTSRTTGSLDSNPAGAIARCKDGTYSHAKTHRGACSRHGGVANWLG